MEQLYSQFPYDDAFRTMESECDDILINYVNFCHGTDYDRNDGNPPEEMFITIKTPGGELSYPIRVIRMSDISVDRIFEEKLFFLIPFYIFNIEKSFRQIEADREKLLKFGEFYRKIFERMNAEVAAGRLSYYSKSVIIRATHRVAYNLTRKNEIIQGKVGEIMGGEIIEMDVIKAHREGKAEGHEEGREEGIRVFIRDKLEDAVPEDIIQKKLEKNYALTPEKAMEYIRKYSGIRTA